VSRKRTVYELRIEVKEDRAFFEEVDHTRGRYNLVELRDVDDIEKTIKMGLSLLSRLSRFDEH